MTAAAVVRVVAAASSLVAVLLFALAACSAARSAASADLASQMAASLWSPVERSPVFGSGLDRIVTRPALLSEYFASPGQPVDLHLRSGESLAKLDGVARWSGAAERLIRLLNRARTGH